MPNHTANKLIVKASTKLFSEIKNAIKGENGQIDFNKIIPMPKELEGTRSPCRIETPEKIKELNAEREQAIEKDSRLAEFLSGEQAITQEEYDRRIEKYGAANWHDWTSKYWGTKWNAYDAEKWTKDKTLYFETAWSPPIPVIVKLSEQFPNAAFTLEYADEGGGFLGSVIIINGKIETETELEWNSKNGIKMLKQLGRWVEEENS